MKRVLLLIFLPVILYAQPEKAPHHVQKRIDKLEKIKLLEVLDLNDETMLKFFNRRNEFNQKIKELNDQKEEKLEQIENSIDEKNEQNIKKLLSEFNIIEDNLHKTRKDYLNSLNDILSYDQIAKLVVFERNFKKEIRDIIFKSRKGRRN